MFAPAAPITAANYPDLVQARNEAKNSKLNNARQLSPGLGDAAALRALKQQEDANTQRFTYLKKDRVNVIFGIALTTRTDNFYEKVDITKPALGGTIFFALVILLGIGVILGGVILI